MKTEAQTRQEIWEIGDREVAPSRGPVLARADINQNNVISRNLQVIPSEPPEKHADIMGWPSEKSERQSIALELAEDSQLILKP